MLIELALVGGGAALWSKLKRKRPNLAYRLSNTPSPSPLSHYKDLVHDMKDAIWGDERQQLQMTIDPNLRAEIERRNKEENRNLRLSAGATGIALLGTLFPAFYWLGSVAVIYMTRPILEIVWRDFQKKHYLSVPMISVVLVFGMIATGRLALAAIGGLIGGFLVILIRKAEDSSEKHLIDVFAEHPSRVWLEKDGVEIQVPFETLQKNDLVVVNAGEIIPADGVIKTGSASIDQHILTGESQPVDRGVGENVFAATLVLAGRLTIQVETAGEKTVAAKIGHVLNNTKTYKDNQMLRGKKIADRLLPVELGIAAVTLGVLGPVPALAILWSGLGSRMILYGPMSVLNYLQILARQGVLIKDGRVLESLRQVDTVVFDKTGTLTLEQPSIDAIHRFGDYDENQVLRYAASAEFRQTHPVARAITDEARQRGITLATPEDTRYDVGYGIKVYLEQKQVHVGSRRFMQREGLAMPEGLDNLQERTQALGYSLIYVGVDGVVVGILEMQPSIRPEAHELIESLRKRGLATYIISGDHEEPTRNIAERLGVDHYFAETLPENKAELINRLRHEGRFICYVGDGINDAIALKSAQVSISLKGASSAATDTAQVVLMDGTLGYLSKLFQIADEFEHTMRNNLLLSIAPGIINIGGIYLLNFGIAASVGLFYVGSTAGLANTVLPFVRHRENRPPQIENVNNR